MQLTEIQNPRLALDDLERVRSPSLGWAVVHDSNPRPRRMYQNRIAGEIRAVARRVVHIEIRAEQIVGANQLFFLIPGKVRQIEHPEAAVLNDDTHRVVVFGRRILDSRYSLPALRIRLS